MRVLPHPGGDVAAFRKLAAQQLSRAKINHFFIWQNLAGI